MAFSSLPARATPEREFARVLRSLHPEKIVYFCTLSCSVFFLKETRRLDEKEKGTQKEEETLRELKKKIKKSFFKKSTLRHNHTLE